MYRVCELNGDRVVRVVGEYHDPDTAKAHLKREWGKDRRPDRDQLWAVFVKGGNNERI